MAERRGPTKRVASAKLHFPSMPAAPTRGTALPTGRDGAAPKGGRWKLRIRAAVRLALDQYAPAPVITTRNVRRMIHMSSQIDQFVT